MAKVIAPAERQVSRGRGRRIGLRVVAILTILMFLGLIPPDITHPITGWLPDASYEQYVELFYGDETPVDMASHRHHMLAFTILVWTILVGMVTQLRSPARRQAPLWTASFSVVAGLIIETALLGFDVFSLLWVVPVLIALLLHPDRRPTEGFWSAGSDRVKVGVAAVAGTVALYYAYGQARLQLTGVDADPHVADGHYAYMAIAGVVLAIAALLGSSNLTGARITAWTGGILGLITGAFFIGFPNYASSPGVAGGVFVVAISLMYLLVVGGGVLSRRSGS